MSHATRGFRPIHKLLVANRGEIAIRVFRACSELGIRTVAVYSYEDRFSLHRYKADEAYQVGVAGAPVSSYLNIEEIVAISRRAGVDAIHPGYGFLAERAELRDVAEAAGIVFVGPSLETLSIAGDKVKTRALAERLKIPTIAGSGVIENAADALKFAERVGFPVMLKASYGGGGRGMRVVRTSSELEVAYQTAQAEALAAFGRADVYLEKFVARPKHVEVQLMGDGTGKVLHLFERDCSVQRRYQKLVEYGPSVSLTAKQREVLFDYALRLGRELRLLSLATAEFLVAEDGNIYFIEINPRIQVEHTVTEEITGVDLVQSQLKIASGASFSDMGLSQEELITHGVAIQCRITTEDPLQDFKPDYGKLVAYRSAAGFGIRLDSGSAFAGGVVTPYYDSLLVKVTARGRTMTEAASRLRRTLREFRIRGVKTNIAFLENLLGQGQFLAGNCRTTFLEEHPEVFQLPRRRDRANRLLRFLADVTVNGHQQMANLTRPKVTLTPPLPIISVEANSNGNRRPQEPAPGWRDRFLKLGIKKFLAEVKAEKRLLVTDTTFRDAHQSLLATRLRTFDMLQVADALAVQVPQLFSLEMWGGATFDVCLRFLREDPWERLAQLRERIPNILFQMLIRGANVVGYTSYPDNVVKAFIKESKDSGIDIFRIFDCFNNLSQMQLSIQAVKEAGGIAEVCLCYTGDLIEEEAKGKRNAKPKYGLKYYTTLAQEFVNAGADILAIKDMAGLLRPYSAELLIRALRESVDIPIHFHTHDTAGVQAASYLKASESGVDIVDCAFSSMSGVTSQPPLEGLVAALQGTERDTGMTLEQLAPFSAYWEVVRTFYEPFESDLKTNTGEVYLNEIPGGQYSNFRPQAASLGLADRWGELKRRYSEVDKLLGGVIKVTPSSKVIGDLALFMVANNLTIEDLVRRASELDFPASVIEFFRGELGEPYGGFDPKLRSAILRGEPPIELRPADTLPPADFEAAHEIVATLLRRAPTRRDILSHLLYPHVYRDYAEARTNFGDLSLLPTLGYLYGLLEGEEIVVDLEPGKRLFITLVAVSEPDERGERTVFFELNGQPRNIEVRDRKLAPEDAGHRKADPVNRSQVGAPLAGVIVNMAVSEGAAVAENAKLFVIEAMKMQTVVHAPLAGKVKKVHIPAATRVEVGDLVVELS